MKASELRIGNCFLYENCIYFASVIRDNFIYGINNNRSAPGEFPINKIEPVHLTKNRLLDLGFIDNELKLTQNTSLYVCLRTENKYFNEGKSLIVQCGVPLLDIPCEYLHELQNIWKALTGEELTIKN